MDNSSFVIYFEPNTVVDVTASVVNGQISWTAPSAGIWILVAAYGQGTGQIESMYEGKFILYLLSCGEIFLDCVIVGTVISFHAKYVCLMLISKLAGYPTAPQIYAAGKGYIVDHFSQAPRLLRATERSTC